MQPSSHTPARSWRSPMIRPDYTGQEPPNKGKTYPIEVLTKAEALALVNACSSRSPSGVRNRALLVTCWRPALRIGEALALLEKDIDFDAGSITILRGKGHKRRVAGCDPDAMTYLARWRDRRRELGFTGRQPFFCTIARDVAGGPINDAYVREMVKERAAKAGIDKRCHPHGLRHTGAFHMMLDGVPLVIIQEQLGHADAATTDRYISHITGRDVVDAMSRRRMTLDGDKPRSIEKVDPTLAAQLTTILMNHGPEIERLFAQLGHLPSPLPAAA